MKRFLKKTVAVLLAVVLLCGSAVCFAAGDKAYYRYDTYVLLGDSVASGHNDLVWINSSFNRVEGSYADLVAKELGSELIPMAATGLRTIDMRYMLEDDYEADDYLFHDVDKQLAESKIPEMRAAIAKADLITLGLGGNDFGTYLTWVLADILSKEGVCDEFVAAMRKYVEENGIENDTVNKLIDLADVMDALPEVMRVMPAALKYGLDNFFENWDHVIEDILALNPDVTLAVTGMFDTGVKSAEDAAANEADAFKINVGQQIVDMANKPMKEGAEKYGYIFVETKGTVCDLYHPNAEGHKHIAECILDALPDANYPYADVPLGSADYKTVEFMYKNDIMSGVTPTAFAPNENLTKAQLADALYAMAGRPEVENADSAQAAIIWAANENILKTDSPNAAVTKAELSIALMKLSFAVQTNPIKLINSFVFALKLLFNDFFASFTQKVTRIDAAKTIKNYCEL